MTYEAVPDDVEITKLTVGQRDALSRYKIHENINTLFANENTPLVVAGLVTAFFGAKLAGDIISDLEEKVGKVSDNVKEGIIETVAKGEKELITDPQTWVATQITGLIAFGAKVRARAEEVEIKPGALA